MSRRTGARLHRRAIGVARFLADALTPTPRARKRLAAVFGAFERPRYSVSVRRRLYRRNLLFRITAARAVPIAIAMIVLVAAGVSLAPAAAPVGAVQPNSGLTQMGIAPDVRLAIGGGLDAAEADAPAGGDVTEPATDAATPIDDGTLYKPVAVDTSVQSSDGMLRHYTVKAGDSLTAIASRFGVSMMTVWWANKLTSKDSLKAGMDLVIPPVNGLVVNVRAGDTLESLAAKYKIDVADIIAVNDLTDPHLIVGAVLVMPGAKGAPMPTPQPASQPRENGNTYTGPAPAFQGGSWAWPVVGGGNYISQYFHYGHYGVDIAAAYGTTIVAPLNAVVIYAGWKNNGGGYQVWLSYGNNLYSAQYHMSAVTVSAGQSVAKGQRVGRIGQSGWATGPHCHFEVWVGRPWESGSYRVNPLKYY